MDGRTDGWTDGRLDGRTGGQGGGRTDGWTNGQAGEGTDGRMDIDTYQLKYYFRCS